MHASDSARPGDDGVRSFRTIYDRHFEFVWRSLRRLGVAESSIDDAVQEVFMAAHRNLDGFENRSTVKTWLFGISLRVAYRFRRGVKRKGHHDPLDERLCDGSPDPAQIAEKAEAMQQLERLLDELDVARRQVFVLAEIDEMTAPEIADVLRIPVNTVYSRLRAARQTFEKAVARQKRRSR